jgi:hypothetical protein
MAESLHCDYNEKLTNTSRDITYWTMVVILQNALIANSTMMGPLERKKNNRISLVSQSVTELNKDIPPVSA